MADFETQTLKHQEAIAKPFVELWTDFFKLADDQTRKVAESMDVQAETQKWRRRWLDALTESMDAYMRSPAFLEAMKHRADMIVKVKEQANDLTKEFARNTGIPTASDISGLFDRLHSIEEIILTRLSGIETRLETIEKHLAKGKAPTS